MASADQLGRDVTAIVQLIVGAVAGRKQVMKVSEADPKLTLANEAIELALMNGAGDGGGTAFAEQAEFQIEVGRRQRFGQWRHRGSGKEVHTKIQLVLPQGGGGKGMKGNKLKGEEGIRVLKSSRSIVSAYNR